MKAIVNCNSYTVCGIGHAQQEPLINKVVDIEQSTPTSAGMFLKNSYNAFVKALEGERQRVKFQKRDNNKSKFIVALIIVIMLLLLNNKFNIF